jgi:hypothetical protein
VYKPTGLTSSEQAILIKKERTRLQEHFISLRSMKGRIESNSYRLTDIFAIQRMCNSYQNQDNPTSKHIHHLLYQLKKAMEMETNLHYAEKLTHEIITAITQRLIILGSKTKVQS